MSPTPARTNREEIVAAARSLLEEEGLHAVTMANVANRVGVRPPSLYKHVRDRSALISAANMRWRSRAAEPARASAAMKAWRSGGSGCG